MTKILNFNDLKSETKMSLFIGKGAKEKQHDMKHTSVQGFIDNATMLQDLGLNPSPIKEMEAYIAVIDSAFPTITEKEIRQWELQQLMTVVQIIQNLGGEDVTDDKEEAASGNVPAAD